MLITWVYLGICRLPTIRQKRKGTEPTDSARACPAQRAAGRSHAAAPKVGNASRYRRRHRSGMERRHRLGRGKDLDLLLRRGSRVSHAFFSVAWRPSYLPISRFVFIVPRSVDKRAVVRNRLRRRIREYLRTRAARITPPRDIAIICRAEAALAARAHLYAALEELLSRLAR